MNVTLKIDNSLCRQARHRAVDMGLSLSAWIAGVMRKELAMEMRHRGLLAELSMTEGEDREFQIPRDPSEASEVELR